MFVFVWFYWYKQQNCSICRLWKSILQIVRDQEAYITWDQHILDAINQGYPMIPFLIRRDFCKKGSEETLQKALLMIKGLCKPCCILLPEDFAKLWQCLVDQQRGEEENISPSRIVSFLVMCRLGPEAKSRAKPSQAHWPETAFGPAHDNQKPKARAWAGAFVLRNSNSVWWWLKN